MVAEVYTRPARLSEAQREASKDFYEVTEMIRVLNTLNPTAAIYFLRRLESWCGSELVTEAARGDG